MSAPRDAASMAADLFGTSVRTPGGGASLRDDVLAPLTITPPSAIGRRGGRGADDMGASDGEGVGIRPRLRGPRLEHLLFMVHGVGQHDDFRDEMHCSWDGSKGCVGGNHEFRELLEAQLHGRLKNVPMALAVRSVEWHSAIHTRRADGSGGSEGVDALLDACMPQGTQIQQLRTITKENVMDVLYYTSSAHAQAIIDAVAGQLTAKWETFASERGGAKAWRGTVHILGHSLGSGNSLLTHRISHMSHAICHMPYVTCHMSHPMLPIWAIHSAQAKRLSHPFLPICHTRCFLYIHIDDASLILQSSASTCSCTVVRHSRASYTRGSLSRIGSAVL